MFYYKEETTSTNDDARDERYTHGDVIYAERQSAGRGQRGNEWISAKGMNVTMSVVLTPHTIAANRQFLISQIAALSLVDLLREYGICALIKWTNDIYVGDKKIAGVLIENSITDTHISRSIIGIGINVNEREFDPSLPNPTSIIVEQNGNTQISRQELINKLHSHIMKWYNELMCDNTAKIESSYHAQMYRLGTQHPFRLANNEVIMGTIKGVRTSGALIVEHADNTQHEYLFKEIEFIISARKR